MTGEMLDKGGFPFNPCSIFRQAQLLVGGRFDGLADIARGCEIGSSHYNDNKHFCLRFNVLTSVIMTSTSFWYITP
jgi:hypothetical protein